MFEQNSTRCRVVAELWSFENIKEFVRQEVGLAIVPGVTVREELKNGTLVRLPLRGARDAQAHTDDLPGPGLHVRGGARAHRHRPRLQLEEPVTRRSRPNAIAKV